MRYRPIKLVIPDYPEVEDMVKTGEKPPFALWYMEPPSPAKLFRLLVFIGNDGRLERLGIGESSITKKCLATWIASYDRKRHRWKSVSIRTIKHWCDNLSEGGMIRTESEKDRMKISVIGFEKIVFLSGKKEVQPKKLCTPFAPPLHPNKNHDSQHSEKTSIAPIRSNLRDIKILPKGNIYVDNEKKKFGEESFEVQLSKELYHNLLEQFDGTKEPDYQKWADHVEKIIRIDGRDQTEIQKVLQWAMADSFWRTNIRSTKKLREKYATLYSQMTNKKTKTDKQQADRDYYDNIISGGSRQIN